MYQCVARLVAQPKQRKLGVRHGDLAKFENKYLCRLFLYVNTREMRADIVSGSIRNVDE